MIAVVSPHLDDAVFSCGEVIAAHPGSIVVSVFAGVPANGDQLTPWDAQSGFGSAAEAVQARRLEDRHALSVLGALPVWLDFSDGQYGQPTLPRLLASALAQTLQASGVDLVLFPLGLFHPDHLLTHEAATAALRELPRRRSLAYEDVPYRARDGVLQQRLAVLGRDRVSATPEAISHPDFGAAKRLALRAYPSQRNAFGAGGLDDTERPERFWRLADAR